MKQAVIIGLAVAVVLLYGPIAVVVFFGALILLALLSSINQSDE